MHTQNFKVKQQFTALKLNPGPPPKKFTRIQIPGPNRVKTDNMTCRVKVTGILYSSKFYSMEKSSNAMKSND